MKRPFKCRGRDQNCLHLFSFGVEVEKSLANYFSFQSVCHDLEKEAIMSTYDFAERRLLNRVWPNEKIFWAIVIESHDEFDDHLCFGRLCICSRKNKG